MRERRFFIRSSADSKKIITREWVENELRFYNTADIKYLTVNLFSLGLALGVLTYLFLLLTWSCFDSLWAKLLMSGPLAFLVLFIVFSILWQLIGKLRERRALKKGNFDVAGLDLLSYAIVVVKLGYLFTELKPFADRELFALSDGASCVELERLNLQRIVRPMFPLDDFDFKA